MRREQKNSPLEIKAANDEGIVEGYLSVWGDPPDSYGDVMVRGAFTETLAKRSPIFLWQHREDMPIGGLLEAREDDYGLWTRWQVDLDIPASRDAYQLIKRKRVNGLSIGFVTVDADFGEDGRRFVKKVDLYEGSAVTFPASERAVTSSVRSDLPIHQLLLNAASHLQVATREVEAFRARRAAEHRDVNEKQREAEQRLDATAEAWLALRSGLVTPPDAEATGADLQAHGLDEIRLRMVKQRLGRIRKNYPVMKGA